MITKIYSVRDVKVGFMPPTVFQNDDVANRSFQSDVLSSNGVLLTHPDDFSLYCLGSFDTETGEIVVNSSPKFISDAGVLLGKA